MEREQIPVTSSKHIETYHETITPESRDQVLPIVTTLTALARDGKITGKIQLNLVQGGVRTIDVENVTETKK